MKHGAEWAYRKQKCRCPECVTWNAAHVAESRRKRSERLDEAPHGTPACYTNWACRRPECTQAFMDYKKRAKQR